MGMKRGSILLVDDDAIILTGLGLVLEKSGFTITTASSGERAIELIRHMRFDVIITDLVMKEVDGLHVLSAAKAADRETMVIVLTGYIDVSFATEAERLSLDDYLLKPCESDELLFRISRCLEKRDLIRRTRTLERTVALLLRGYHEAALVGERLLQMHGESAPYLERYFAEMVHLACAIRPQDRRISFVPAPALPVAATPAFQLPLLGSLLYAATAQWAEAVAGSDASTAGNAREHTATVSVGLLTEPSGSLLTVDLSLNELESDGFGYAEVERRAQPLIEASKTLSPGLDGSFRVVDNATCRYSFRVGSTGLPVVEAEESS